MEARYVTNEDGERVGVILTLNSRVVPMPLKERTP